MIFFKAELERYRINWITHPRSNSPKIYLLISSVSLSTIQNPVQKKFKNYNLSGYFLIKTCHLKLQGMSCAGCASAIEKAIQEVVRVTQGNVNFAISQATVTYDQTMTNLSVV